MVEATDEGVPQRTGTATVTLHVEDLNDNVPVFINTPYDVSVLEDVDLRMEVVQVQATDADVGENARVTYEMIDYVEGRAGDFDVNVNTGNENIFREKKKFKQHKITI